MHARENLAGLFDVTENLLPKGLRRGEGLAGAQELDRFDGEAAPGSAEP